MSLVWPPLAIQRETIMIIALSSLTVAGVIFAAGAITMFVRERRALRTAGADGPSQEPTQPETSDRSVTGS